MTTVPLETPGADEADLKAAIGALVGRELIANETISTPQTFVDIALPEDYSLFHLELRDVSHGDTSGLAAWFSSDGGATWPVDWDNWDIYEFERVNVAAGSLFVNRTEFDAVIGLGYGTITSTFNIIIDPGTASRKAMIRAEQLGGNSAFASWARIVGGPKAVGRQNMIRFAEILELYAVDAGSGMSPPDPRCPVSLSYTLTGVRA